MTKTLLNTLNEKIKSKIYGLIKTFPIESFSYLKISQNYSLGYEIPTDSSLNFQYDYDEQELYLSINNDDPLDPYYDEDLVITEDEDSLIITLTDKYTKKIITTFDNLNDLITYLEEEYWI